MAKEAQHAAPREPSGTLRSPDAIREELAHALSRVSRFRRWEARTGTNYDDEISEMQARVCYLRREEQIYYKVARLGDKAKRQRERYQGMVDLARKTCNAFTGFLQSSYQDSRKNLRKRADAIIASREAPVRDNLAIEWPMAVVAGSTLALPILVAGAVLGNAVV